MGLKKSFQKLLQKKTSDKENDTALATKISTLIGRKPKNIDLYKEAFSVKTSKSEQKNYERLEFLGDSVLGSIISYHIYNTYPEENEGFLTQMKAKIVNRKNLNLLGDKLGIRDFIIGDGRKVLSQNISGNLLEAFIGAVFIDLGYDVCKKIIMDKFFTGEEIEKLENKIVSYKSLILEWSQKKKITVKYVTTEEVLPNKSLAFRTELFLDDRKAASATESSKKKSEEKAAQRAIYGLNKKEKFFENQKNIT